MPATESPSGAEVKRVARIIEDVFVAGYTKRGAGNTTPLMAYDAAEAVLKDLASRTAAKGETVAALVDAVERVIVTAVAVTEPQGDEDVVVGYSHKTGAMHALLTAVREAGSSVSFQRPTPARATRGETTPAPSPGACPQCETQVPENEYWDYLAGPFSPRIYYPKSIMDDNPEIAHRFTKCPAAFHAPAPSSAGVTREVIPSSVAHIFRDALDEIDSYTEYTLHEGGGFAHLNGQEVRDEVRAILVRMNERCAALSFKRPAAGAPEEGKGK